VSRRDYAAVAVALCLVLSGCGGIDLGGSPPAGEPSSTEPASNSTVNTVGNLTEAEFPEGFSQSRIDISIARERSVRYLQTEPVSGVALERFRPGAYADYQYEANATQTRFRLDVHNGYTDITRNDVYVESNVRHSRNGRNGRASFESTPGSVADTRLRAANSMWAVVSRILTVGDFRAIEAVGSTDERRIRYTATDVAVRNATDVRGYLTVDGDGIVQEARLLYTQAGEPKRFEYAVTSPPNGSVAAPAWLPAARTDSGSDTEPTNGDRPV
jgi:hypothetical protein